MVSNALLKRAISDEWQTPTWLLDAVRQIAPIQVDLASQESNPTQASEYFTLLRPFTQDSRLLATGLVFCNPPYSESRKWAGLISSVANPGKRELIALVASRTDTRWWNTLVEEKKPLICFLKGRLRFMVDGVPSKNTAPFPSALLYYGFDEPKFRGVFKQYGHLVKVL